LGKTRNNRNENKSKLFGNMLRISQPRNRKKTCLRLKISMSKDKTLLLLGKKKIENISCIFIKDPINNMKILKENEVLFLNTQTGN
jgi:hypothetical protein